MSHVARIGRNSWRVRVGMSALYVVLVLGAVTTVYPFLLMVSTATKSQSDFTRFELLPAYLTDTAVLYTKYLEDRYANDLDTLNNAHNADYARLADAALPTDSRQEAALAEDWEQFSRTLPVLYKKAGFGEHDNAPTPLLLRYRSYLRDEFKGDIASLNKAWTEENVGFDSVTPPFERTARREWMPDTTSPKVRDWMHFRETLPANYAIVTASDPIYRAFLRQDVYSDDLGKLNTAWQSHYPNWNAVTLPPHPTGNTAAQRDWEQFIRTKFPLRMIGVAPAALPVWRQFLAGKHRAGAIVATLTLPSSVPVVGQGRTDWMEFIARVVPAQFLTADSAENLWRAHLHQKLGDIAKVNNVFGTRWASFADAAPPQPIVDARFVRANAAALRGEFATRNFRAVSGYILLHGRAVLNTIVFCLLAIGAAVIVNPLCAYALSRYPLPYAYKVLLFLLATMAFPAEVAMIPNFLLLRDLGMLNTFAALVLPGVASGFSIFLLKGFFDSLPKELYEAAVLDGAGELRMFRRITVPLSLPIFSVIALNAFTASYGAFLFAMVVCQEPQMWTLMVWLYNLQDSAPQYVIMAALTLAALPTLIVFLFAQKVILRGIILPSFK